MNEHPFEDRNTAFTFNFDSSNFVIPELPEYLPHEQGELTPTDTSKDELDQELKDLSDEELSLLTSDEKKEIMKRGMKQINQSFFEPNFRMLASEYTTTQS